MPNLESLSESNQDSPTNLVNTSRTSIGLQEKDYQISTRSSGNLSSTTGSPEVKSSSYTRVPADDMKEKISAMGVIASKQDPRNRKIMNGSEHNNKQDKHPRDTVVAPRDGPVIEVCAKSQLEVSPKQFLKITKLKAFIEKKPTTVDENSPGVLKYKTPHFRSGGTFKFSFNLINIHISAMVD